MRFTTLFSPAKIEIYLFSLLILLLPTQLGKHFWPAFSVINGIRVDYLSPTLYVTDLLTIALFVVWIIQKQPLRIHITRNGHIFLGVILFLLLNSIFSGVNYASLYGLIKFLEFSFVAFYVSKAIPRVLSLGMFTSLFAIGTLAESLMAIFQYFNQGSIGGLLYFLGERSFTAATPGIANASLNGELVMRAYGTLPHPNVLAGYLLVSMLLIFFYLYSVKNYYMRLLAASSLLLGTIALLLTLSRVGILLWIVFVLTIAIWQFFRSRLAKYHGQRWFHGIFIILLLVVFAQLLVPRFLTTSLTDEAIIQRQLLMQAALQMALERPVMGVGLSNFLSVLDDRLSPLSLGLYLQPVHNIFLLVLAETGVVGLGFFLWGFGKSYYQLFRKNHLHTGFPVVLCLSVIVVTGLVDHYWLTLQQGQLLLAIVLGLVWKRS